MNLCWRKESCFCCTTNGQYFIKLSLTALVLTESWLLLVWNAVLTGNGISIVESDASPSLSSVLCSGSLVSACCFLKCAFYIYMLWDNIMLNHSVSLQPLINSTRLLYVLVVQVLWCKVSGNSKYLYILWYSSLVIPAYLCFGSG